MRKSKALLEIKPFSSSSFMRSKSSFGGSFERKSGFEAFEAAFVLSAWLVLAFIEEISLRLRDVCFSFLQYIPFPMGLLSFIYCFFWEGFNNR